jgi:drug/metabolite transporter (DMT)-like permease
LFGISAPISKLLLGEVPPQLLAGLLYLGAGIGLGVAWLWRRANVDHREVSLRASDSAIVAAAIAFGGVLAPLLLLIGLQHFPASAASLFLNFETVFTAAIAWIVFKEHVNVGILLGLLSIVCGGVVLSYSEAPELAGWLGPVCITGACLCWAIDNNITQKISDRDPVQIAALKGLLAGTVNCAIGLFLARTLPAWTVAGGSLLLGFLSYGASLVLYIRALRAMGTARTGNYFSMAPFIGAVVSVILWREPVTLQLVGAGLFMAAGLWLHLTERHAHWHSHEPLDHEHLHVHDEHHQHQHGPNESAAEPHSHPHHHDAMQHSHEHYPDIHHRHEHEK